MKQRKPGGHEWRSNTLPAIVMTTPVTAMLILLVALPLVYVLIMSFCKLDAYYNVVYEFTTKSYASLLNANYVAIYAQSLLIAFLTTVICILLAFPFTYLITRTYSAHKKILYMMVIIPFWTNSLIRIYGWRTFLGTNGFLNNVLQALNILQAPADFLFNRGTTVLGMVYCLIPFMVLPLYSSLEKLDQSLLEASADLGANRIKTLFNVIIPLTADGIFSGCIMVFIPCLGYFFVADILGGGNADVIGNLIERQFQSGNNWPLGSALSIILIVVTLLLVTIYQKLGGSMEALGQ